MNYSFCRPFLSSAFIYCTGAVRSNGWCFKLMLSIYLSRRLKPCQLVSLKICFTFDAIFISTRKLLLGEYKLEVVMSIQCWCSWKRTTTLDFPDSMASASLHVPLKLEFFVLHTKEQRGAALLVSVLRLLFLPICSYTWYVLIRMTINILLHQEHLIIADCDWKRWWTHPD